MTESVAVPERAGLTGSTSGVNKAPMINFIRVLSLALAFFGPGLSVAFADAAPGSLRQVERMSLDIAPLDEDSAACGVTRGRITASVREFVAKAPFKMDGEKYILLVRISSLPKDGDCFSSVDLGVYYKGRIALPASQDGLGKAVLWENGTILISPRSQHWPEVENIMDHLIRGLIAEWDGDNAGSG